MLTVITKYNWRDWSAKIGLLSFFLVLVSSFLLPESLNITRLENILLPLIFIAIVGVNTFKSNKTIIYTLLILFATSIFSNIVNFKSIDAYMVSIRFLKYIFLFIITGHLVKEYAPVFNKIIDIIVLSLIVINLIQIFNPFNWGVDLLKLYSNHVQNYELNRVFNRNFRLFGSQNNPNNNAIIWGMLLIYYFIKNINGRSIFNLLMIIFSTIFLFLTQSRTALVAILFSFGIYFILKHFNLKTFLLLILGGGLFLVILKISGLSYMQQLLTTNPLEIHSMQLRYNVWESLIKLWKNNPVFGWGLQTNFVNKIGMSPDNEFLFFLASGGLLFIIPYCFIFSSILFIGIKKLKTSQNPYYGLYILLPLFLLINSITNYSLNNVKVASFFFILLALVNAPLKNIK